MPNMYKPPFIISSEAMKLLAEIGSLPATHTRNWQVNDVLEAHAAIGGEARFRQSPPAPHWVPVLLESLLQWVNTSSTHPLIRAAVFHYELVRIHPFEAGNCYVAEYLEKAMRQSILGDLYVNITPEDYESCMAATDATDYIYVSLCAILAALRAQRANAIPRRNSARRQASPQEQILRYLNRYPGSKRQDILAAIPALSARVLDRHLQMLREEQKIEYRGSRKTGAYYPGE